MVLVEQENLHMLSAIEAHRLSWPTVVKNMRARAEARIEAQQAELNRLNVQEAAIQATRQDLPRRFKEELEPLIKEAALRGEQEISIPCVATGLELHALQLYLSEFLGLRGYKGWVYERVIHTNEWYSSYEISWKTPRLTMFLTWWSRTFE